ncbi:UNVERIFIED_CONTAM: putative bacteriocin precursor [Acetivibrio alkalicellulosi]
MKKLGKNIKKTKHTVEAYSILYSCIPWCPSCTCGNSSVANVQVFQGTRNANNIVLKNI